MESDKIVHIGSDSDKFEISDLSEIIEYLTHIKSSLKGDWIKKNSSYEKEACLELGFECEGTRFWDCKYKDYYIEMKKGKAIWFDEVRYSEICLKDIIDSEIEIDSRCKKNTYTMFMIPSKEKSSIEKIYIVNTKKIISLLDITPEWALTLLKRFKDVNRTINCQHRITIKQLKDIADFEI